ncbi:MAG: nucleotide exchange factor GrpE [Bacteroidales bacterium]|nr:nucleotide exchange factor GrpE [Bacteroidales bacterium]
MDNINEFEDFDVEVVETSKTSIEEVQEEVVETSEIEESCECENNNCADSTECTEEVVDEAVPSEEIESENNDCTDSEECIEENYVENVEKVSDEIKEEVQEKESDSSNKLIATLIEKIESLSAQNELLQNKFDSKIAQDEHKAQLFDKMYSELQNYKNDIYAKILKPFVLSTVSLLDDTNTFIAKLGENESAMAEKYLRSIPDDLIDVLESNGVVLYEDNGDKFNPRTQRALKQVPTDNQELDGFIAKRVRKGYSWNGVNLKPELVWVYKFKQE